MTAPFRPAAMLAVGATATALSLSILAGWQRGGSLLEQAVWVAIGIVLVVSAHLLPALIRDAPIPCAVWAACYGSHVSRPSATGIWCSSCSPNSMRENAKRRPKWQAASPSPVAI
jgi:hypothetical protein